MQTEQFFLREGDNSFLHNVFRNGSNIVSSAFCQVPCHTHRQIQLISNFLRWPFVFEAHGALGDGDVLDRREQISPGYLFVCKLRFRGQGINGEMVFLDARSLGAHWIIAGFLFAVVAVLADALGILRRLMASAGML